MSAIQKTLIFDIFDNFLSKYIPNGVMADITPSFHRPCAEIFKMASHSLGYGGMSARTSGSFYPTVVRSLNNVGL